MTIKENLMQFNKSSLISLCKFLRLSGYSRLHKKEMAEMISSQLLSHQIAEKNLLFLNQKSTLLLEALLKKGKIPYDHLDDMITFLILGYTYDDNKELSICTDAAELFSKIYTEELKKKHEKIMLVQSYCAALTRLYGIISADDVFDIYDRQNHDLSKEEFRAIIDYLSEGHFIWYISDNTLFYIFNDTEEYHNLLLSIHSDIINSLSIYYIPSRKKILKYADEDYFDKTNEYIKLFNYLTNKMYLTDETADDLCKYISHQCLLDNDTYVILDDDLLLDIGVKTQKDFDNIYMIIEQMHNTTRKQIFFGYTGQELNDMGLYDNIDIPYNVSMTRAAPKKIGRNEPCPCGSGKKYKNCCGR